MRSRKVLYNIVSNLSLQFITIIFGFIVPKLFISHFGSETNGLIASITQFLGYITLLESGVGPVIKAALYKKIAKNNKKEIETVLLASEKFFRNISKIFIIYISVLCIIYPLLINNNFGYIYTVSLIIILSISTFAEYYFGMTYSLFLQAKQKSYVIKLIQIITYVLNAIITIVMIKFNVSLHLIKLLSCLVFLLRPLAQNIYIRRVYKINLKNGDPNYVLKQKWDGLSQHIAYVIHTNTDITLLSIFGNLTMVSIYYVYNIVVSGINKIISGILSGFSAGFGDMIAKDEIDNLNKKFSTYEFLFYSICTIMYSCTILLINHFVHVYTYKISDANYVQNVFGILIVLSEFIWAIRGPYSSIIISAGHFKQTKRGAWVESISNIVISIIFVKKYGLVGVAVGTVTAMFIRSIELIIYANKHILKRKIIINVKKILMMIFEVLSIIYICKQIMHVDQINYYCFFINGLKVFAVSSLITLVANYLAFKKDFKDLLHSMKVIFLKKSR